MNNNYVPGTTLTALQALYYNSQLQGFKQNNVTQDYKAKMNNFIIP